VSTPVPPPAQLASHRFAYPRERLKVGIVHFGVGNFHRSHQAWYLHRLLNEDPGLLDWGICGVGLLPGDLAMRDALAAQDNRFTVLEKQPGGGVTATVVGSLVEYLFAPADPLRVVERIAHPDTRIVTLTITEGGYDVTPRVEPAGLAAWLRYDAPFTVRPVSAFGYLAMGLALRCRRGGGKLTVLSCDNIQGNGELARRVCREFAALGGPEFAAWVTTNVTFPNCMVDRITPVTSAADRALARERFALSDAWPVPAEPFIQWVVEDDFAAGRPPLERVGVQFVHDVAPYEKMKLRLLNCSHQALGYFGVLLGHRYVHEAAADPDIVKLLRDYMDLEATPTLDPVPGVDLAHYQATLIERFQNEAIGDTLARICAFSSDRIRQWMLPVVHEQLRRGGPVSRCAAVVASWARYLEATDAAGQPHNVVDALKDELIPLADQRRNPAAAFLDHPLFAGLGGQPRFAGAFLEARRRIDTAGPRAALRHLD